MSSTTEKKEKIANSIIELMEKTGLPAWRCPWIFGARDLAFKGSEYNGVNAVITALARTACGYKSRLWLTHTKIEALNGKTWTLPRQTARARADGSRLKRPTTAPSPTQKRAPTECPSSTGTGSRRRTPTRTQCSRTTELR